MVSSFPSPGSPRSRLLLLLATGSSSDQGFTMFEVLVALMMSFLFLTGTLNAMVVSTIFQVRAERQAQANYWIQEDLEGVRAAAANYTVTTGCPSLVGESFRTNANGLPALTNATRTIVGTTATLARSSLGTGNVATLTYSVTANGQTLATLYTEVLPAAALSC